MSMFGLLSRSPREKAARALYTAAVGRARDPVFYRDWGVPDTVDGRFDLIAVHVILVLRRLGRAGTESAALGQEVCDLFFLDMDENLREMGVGDLSVGKRVKEIARAFYGRVAAYDAALDARDQALEDALRRNLFRKSVLDPGQIAFAAGYVRAVDAHLAAQDGDRLRAGTIDFPPTTLPYGNEDDERAQGN
jgi:cytochrome b pre-mRNA-processing protein 3